MNRIKSILFAALAVFSAASCNKEYVEQNPEANAETVVFTASIDDADTKTVLNGAATEWVAGDKITIHNGSKGYTFTAKEAGAKSEFSYSGNDFSGEKFIAVYPAGNYTADIAEKTVVAHIPINQASRSNSFNEEASTAVAYTESNTLSFKHAVSLLKFTVKGNNIKGLIYFGNNNEGISGDVKIALNSSDNTVMSVVPQVTKYIENDVNKEEVVKFAKLYAETDNWCFKEGVTYYMAVAPQNFSKGFTTEIEVDGVGKVTAKKLSTTKELEPGVIYDLGEFEYKAPELDEMNWGVVGDMTDWADNADIPMTLENDWYVARNITITTDDAFKFRTDGKWGTERTCSGPVEAGVEVAVAAGMDDITVAVSAIYDVYLSKNADKMKLVKVGDVVVEEPETTTPGLDSEWALAGTFNSWGNKIFKTTETADLFVVTNVVLAAYDEIKVKVADNWDTSYGGGIKNLKPNQWMKVYSNGSNIPVTTAGTYDVYFDKSSKKLYLMEAGKSYTTATEQTTDGPQAPTPSTWYLVGSFNNWNPADSAYQMSDDGTYYVFKNFTSATDCQLKFAPGKWGGDKGGEGKTFAVDTWFKTTEGSNNNIAVKAGTYDVYLKKDASQYKFVTPGQNP